MFAIEVQHNFYATHALRLPGGQIEPAHAHNFQVTARVACDKLDEIETVMDFHDLQKLLEAITSPWSNQDINSIEPFKSKVNPSAERMAEVIGRELVRGLPKQAVLEEVRLTEAAGCVAVFRPIT